MPLPRSQTSINNWSASERKVIPITFPSNPYRSELEIKLFKIRSRASVLACAKYKVSGISTTASNTLGDYAFMKEENIVDANFVKVY